MKTMKFVTVVFPGSSEETIIAEFTKLEEAIKHARKYTKDTWFPTDVMRRLDDGTLTTEI